MLKKIFTALTLLLVLTVATTGCTVLNDTETQNKVEDANALVFDQQLDNGVQLQIFKIASGTLTAQQAEVLPGHETGEKIVAVRYVLTNKTEKPVDIKNVTLWNANFRSSPNGVGVYNFSDTSLHAKLGHPTLPEQFTSTDSSEWLLAPGESAQFAYDWIVDSKDLLMDHYIVFPGSQTVHHVEVDLNKK